MRKRFAVILAIVLSCVGVMAEAHHHFHEAPAGAGRDTGSRFIAADGSARDDGEDSSHGICPVCFFIAFSHGLPAAEDAPLVFSLPQNRPLPAREISPESPQLAAVATRAPPAA
ncbi:MAG: hypothetical protein JXA20_13105 [Spirochaetes bacterium]|nr:hypothetical protein [Spirochaetota bacterium]